MTSPIAGNDYTSPSGRQWRWCRMWECWEFDDYTYKIHPGPDGYVCSSFEVWHGGLFKTFEDAEIEVIDE